MKKLIILSFFLFLAFNVQAQDEEDARQRIEAARIALISERLGLTPEQAEQFWPIYREFVNERNSLRDEFRDARQSINLEQATEEEKRALLETRLQLKEREASLERQYSERMLNVISTKQILSLRQAEEDFRQMIIDRIRDRQRQQRFKQEQRNQQQEQLRNRRNN